MLSKVLRAIAALLVVVLLIILLSSCDHNTVDSPDKRFKILESHYNFTVYVDMETGVEWLHGDQVFVPIIDSYGSPYIYPAFDAREDRPNGT